MYKDIYIYRFNKLNFKGFFSTQLKKNPLSMIVGDIIIHDITTEN
jgi:hypothetical protein